MFNFINEINNIVDSLATLKNAAADGIGKTVVSTALETLKEDIGARLSYRTIELVFSLPDGDEESIVCNGDYEIIGGLDDYSEEFQNFMQDVVNNHLGD